MQNKQHQIENKNNNNNQTKTKIKKNSTKFLHEKQIKQEKPIIK